ncbi:MAG: DUF3224 domain-containing protein [Rhodothermales bacterium]|nr:DUF3224 domain-containing protein [Rhodothermales bacterium]
MSIRALCPFDITEWNETPYGESEGGPRLARTVVRKLFRGDLDGESSAEVLMCQADADNLSAGAGYVASEQVEGSLHGRRGSFVMQHGALAGPSMEPTTFGQIVPGSGTRELQGISGTVEIERTPDGAHILTLDYSLE